MPLRLLFFDLRNGRLNPGGHGFQVLFQCAFIRFLARKSQLVQDSPDVIAVMPEVELTTDDLSDPQGGPAGVRKAVDLRPLDEKTF